VDRDAPKGCILNSRILWFFSRAYQATGDPALLSHAQHAYAFLQRFWDGEYGGVYWSVTADGKPLDTVKHTYAQAFAIYALSTYALASGLAEPREQAMALYLLIETRMKDSVSYLEAFDREFKPLSNAKLSDNPKLLAKGIIADKTMNTLLHVMEAYTALHEATADQTVAESLRAVLRTITKKVYDPCLNRLEVFFDADMRTVFDMQSFGHDIEASWLIDLAARRVLAGEALGRVTAMTATLAQGVFERAFRDGSLANEQTEGDMDETRIWWVQAETLVGLTNLWQKTGDPAIRQAMDEAWTYIMGHIVDLRAGSEWLGSIDPAGSVIPAPIVDPWKCPYHNGRMCLELMARL
jgi:mannobiose 2-epimerase